MATPSNPAHFQAQNSPRSRQARGFSAVQPPPSESSCPPLTISDYDQLAASSFSSPSHSFPANDAKQIWNKPSNDSVSTEVTAAVMGADSWPALPGSARASSKTNMKALSHPSETASQDMPVGTLSLTKDVSTSDSNGQDAVLSRNWSKKHDGAGGNSSHSRMSANDNFPQGPPTQGTVVETTPPGLVKSGGWVRESSRRDSGQRGGFHGANEVHPQQHGSFRKNNSGPLFRGDDVSHNRNVGGKRDQYAPQRRVGSRPFLHGASPTLPFIPHLPYQGGVRPFETSMVCGEMPSPFFYVPGPYPNSLGHMSMVPIPSMVFPSMTNPYLHFQIVNQIDYYFSNENLVKDIFLRKKMDNEGWVSINLIAGFKKVMQLTDNIQLILHSIRASNVVEVQGDKVRRKNDWNKWIIPPMKSPEPNQSMLAAHLQSVGLGGKAVI